MFFRRFGNTATIEETVLPDRQEAMDVPAAHAVLGTPMIGPFPDGMERIVLSMTCFWGPERRYWQLDGVYTTAVGYAGGITKNPTYNDVSSGSTGHAESVLVVYDPEKVELTALLAIFWEYHDPTTPLKTFGFGSQYRSAIFTTTAAQHEAVLQSRDRYQRRLTDRGFSKIRTEIAEAGEFFYAEAGHQQYMQKNPGAFCPSGFCQVSYE